MTQIAFSLKICLTSKYFTQTASAASVTFSISSASSFHLILPPAWLLSGVAEFFFYEWSDKKAAEIQWKHEWGFVLSSCNTERRIYYIRRGSSLFSEMDHYILWTLTRYRPVHFPTCYSRKRRHIIQSNLTKFINKKYFIGGDGIFIPDFEI